MSDAKEFDLAATPFAATVSPPGDKSLGHRALILAAMARGESKVANTPSGADLDATRAATMRLGVEYSGDRVSSPGIADWTSSAGTIDCGNSGTTMRLLTGAIAGSATEATLVGDASLMKRPMRRLVDPLEQLGADITVAPSGTAPIRVRGNRLAGAEVGVPMASAQVRTAVALAALSAEGQSRIESPPGYRDHTERLLAHLGLGEVVSPTVFIVKPGPVSPFEVTLPGDVSSAAFLWAAAAVVPGSRIVTPAVSLNPGRLGFLEVLERMGASVVVESGDAVMGDPVGTVTVEAAPLRGITVGGELSVGTLDELPLLAVVAAAASGPTVVADAAELSVKESDRIASSVDLARLAGAAARAKDDGFVVDPAGDTSGDGIIDAEGDHRIAMAAAIAALVRGSSVTVNGFSAANVSWPGFDDVLEGLWS